MDQLKLALVNSSSFFMKIIYLIIYVISIPFRIVGLFFRHPILLIGLPGFALQFIKVASANFGGDLRATFAYLKLDPSGVYSKDFIVDFAFILALLVFYNGIRLKKNIKKSFVGEFVDGFFAFADYAAFEAKGNIENNINFNKQIKRNSNVNVEEEMAKFKASGLYNDRE